MVCNVEYNLFKVKLRTAVTCFFCISFAQFMISVEVTFAIRKGKQGETAEDMNIALVKALKKRNIIWEEARNMTLITIVLYNGAIWHYDI